MRTPKDGAAWLAQLRAPDEKSAHEARLFLGGITPDDCWMLDAFLAGTASSDDYIRFWSSVAAHRCAMEHTALARRMDDLLSDPTPAVRAVAAQTLLVAAPTIHSVARLSGVARSDPDAFVRRDAARAIGQAPASLRTEAIAQLIPLLADEDIANAVAIAIKVIVLDEGRAPEGLQASSVSALREAARVVDANTASQLRVALGALEGA